jgi:serine/threonine-protein kinase
MTEATKQWEGRIVEGIFPLRQYLGGSEHSAVFVTEYREGELQKAAIKLVPANPLTAETQLMRWEFAAQLSHPNLLRVFRSGRTAIDGNELLYVVMEFADEDLADILPERALTAEETRDMVCPVLDALEYLHGKGFVHSDLKPANILASVDQLKLSSDALLRIGESQAGTKKVSAYDPPEAISGTWTPAGDVWSLGTTLVEVMTQRVPEWQPGPHLEPAVPATLPAPFLEIARQCLRVEPKQRISIGDIAARLNPRAAAASAAAAGLGASAVAMPMPPTPALAPPPAAAPAVQRPIVSQAVSPRSTPQVQPRIHPSPRPPAYYGESRPRSRFIGPLVVVALVFGVILIVPRFLTLRPAAQPAPAGGPGASLGEAGGKKGAPSATAPNSASAKAEPEKQVPASETAASVRRPEEKAGQPSPQPPVAESLKPTSEKGQPSSVASRRADSASSESIAKPARAGIASPKGEVLDQVLPDVSQKARDTIHGKVRVSVKVHVDPAGAVSAAELDSAGPSQYFADLALQAARRWAFTPPEVDGKSVASEWRLRFEFGPKDTRVTPTQTAP